MKKKLGYLFVIMFCIAAVGAAFSYGFGTAGKQPEETIAEESDELNVVASFYPIYIIAQNLCQGVPGVQVQNLTENQTGCLHDYQLTTRDMKKLEQADLLMLNGGGMESFLETAIKGLSNLQVISSEDGIDLLEAQSEHHHEHMEEHADEEEEHEEEEHDHAHDHGEHNAHIWLDPHRYYHQVENLAAGLIQADPEHRSIYEENRNRYLDQIEAVHQEYQEVFAEMQMQPVIIFHDAFAYYSELLPLEIVKIVAIEGEESALSAGEMAEVVEEIRMHQIQYLLIEEQYQQTVADVLAEETGAQTVVLDSLVTGGEGADAWLVGMRSNLEILRECFGR